MAAPPAAGKRPCGVTRVVRDLAPECRSCSLSTIPTDLDRSAASLGPPRGVSRVLSASPMTLPQRSASGSMMTEMLLDREASYRLAKVRFRIPRGISLKASAGSNRLRGRAKHHSDMIGRARVNAATGLIRRYRHPNGAGSGGISTARQPRLGPLAANLLACSRARARGRLDV